MRFSLFKFLKRKPPKNSIEVERKVAELESELRPLIVDEARKSVRETLELGINLKFAEFLGDEPSEEEIKKHEYFLALPEEEKEQYVERETKKKLNSFGACYFVWIIKQQILKERYGIEWYTPSEENPDAHYL